MSWFVVLTPLLILPLLGLLRLVGCAEKVVVNFEEPGPPDADDEDDPDSERVDPDDIPDSPPPVPGDPQQAVFVAAARNELRCPVDDDQPFTPVPVQLAFSDPEDGREYEVTVTLERQGGGDVQGATVSMEVEETGRPRRNLVCFACIRQQTPYVIRAEVRRMVDGEATPVGDPASCRSSGLIDEGAVVRFEWSEDGEPAASLCLETP